MYRRLAEGRYTVSDNFFAGFRRTPRPASDVRKRRRGGSGVTRRREVVWLTSPPWIVRLPESR